MMATLVLAAQLAGASPMPPQDWSVLRPLPYARDADDGVNLSGFVRSEVKAGHCAAAIATSDGWMLKVDLAVFVGSAGLPRRVVPRAIGCPSVEQYAAGLVSSMVRGNVAAVGIDSDTWYRTTLTFSWPA